MTYKKLKKNKSVKKNKKQKNFTLQHKLYIAFICLLAVFVGTTLLIIRPKTRLQASGNSPIQANLLQNPNLTGFTGNQFPDWIFHLQGTGIGTISSDTTNELNGFPSAKVTVTTASPSAPWDTQLAQLNVPLLAGKSYQLLYYAKTDTYRNIDVLIQQTKPPYKVYYQETVPMGPAGFSGQKAVEFTMPSTLPDSNVAVRFDFGQTTGNVWLNSLDLFQLPDPHPVYFGTEFQNGFIQSQPSTFLPAVTQEQSKVNHGLSIVTDYQGWPTSIKNPFVTQMYQDMRNYGAITLFSWGSGTDGVSSQPDYTLESIINGSHDAYINTYAEAAKAWGHPFFLRFDWEMNGNWYAWDEGVNGNQPGQFVQAWRHVWNIFKQDGVTNVTWVWCPNNSSSFGTPLSEFYPGDQYVDWTCIDAYNNGGSSWSSFFSIVRPAYEAILQFAPNKPMMIGETGTVEQGGSKPAWFTDAFTKELPYIFPQVYAALYYDVHWTTGGGLDQNDLVNTTPTSLAAFNSAIQLSINGLPIYLSNTYGNLPSGIIGKP